MNRGTAVIKLLEAQQRIADVAVADVVDGKFLELLKSILSGIPVVIKKIENNP